MGCFLQSTVLGRQSLLPIGTASPPLFVVRTVAVISMASVDAGNCAGAHPPSDLRHVALFDPMTTISSDDLRRQGSRHIANESIFWTT